MCKLELEHYGLKGESNNLSFALKNKQGYISVDMILNLQQWQNLKNTLINHADFKTFCIKILKQFVEEYYSLFSIKEYISNKNYHYLEITDYHISTIVFVLFSSNLNESELLYRDNKGNAIFNIPYIHNLILEFLEDKEEMESKEDSEDKKKFHITLRNGKELSTMSNMDLHEIYKMIGTKDLVEIGDVIVNSGDILYIKQI